MWYWEHELVLERRSLKLRFLFSLFTCEEVSFCQDSVMMLDSHLASVPSVLRKAHILLCRAMQLLAFLAIL